MNDYDSIDAFDILGSGLEFDPTNWQDISLLILVLLFTIGGIIYVLYESKHGKNKPTHHYNKKTGKVEKIEE